MDVRNCLTCVLAIVDHQSVSASESLLFGDLGSCYQHLAQNDLVLFLGLGDASESVLVLGDDDDVGGGNRGDIAEGEDVLILEDHGAWDLLVDEFVEDRLLGHKQLQSSPITGLSYENAKDVFLGEMAELKEDGGLVQLWGRLCGDLESFLLVLPFKGLRSPSQFQTVTASRTCSPRPPHSKISLPQPISKNDEIY